MLFWRWVSSFNLSPLFSYNHSSFHVTERQDLFSFEYYIYPCSIKKLQAISLTSWQRTNSAHMNCALYTYSVCTECSWCLVKCSWKRRRRSGGVEENTACGKSLPASQRSPTLTSELHSTHRLSAAHCTQRSLLRLIF